MSEIIRLFPDRLNLNGDQANALVMQKRAAWAGLSIDVVDYEDLSTLEPLISRIANSDAPVLVILGHGSRAAMSSISHLKSQVEALLATCKDKRHTVLVIGSSTEWLLDHSQGERSSEFWAGQVSYEDGEFEVVGYLNSQASLDPIWVDGSLFYTLLHGPVLAKSSAFADYLILKLTGKRVVSQKIVEISGYENEAIKTALG